MAQATAIKPILKERKCAKCPYYQSHNEPQSITDEGGQSFPNPRFGCGWCNLFNQSAKEHHQMTHSCVLNGALNTKTDKLRVNNATVERTLITIEFAPDIHPEETEYTYPHPQFVFGERVIIKNHFPE